MLKKLNKIKANERMIDAIVAHIERLRRIQRHLGGEGRGEQYAHKLENLTRLLNLQAEENAEAKLECLSILNTLEGEERAVIEYYYCMGYTVDMIANIMHYDPRTIHNRLKSARDKLQGKEINK